MIRVFSQGEEWRGEMRGRGNVTGKCPISNASLVWAADRPWTGQAGQSQACAEAALQALVEFECRAGRCLVKRRNQQSQAVFARGFPG